MSHDVAPEEEYLPPSQSEHDPAPAREYLPGVQKSPKVPAGQSESQDIDPAAENVPAAHAWQLLSFSYLPATQSEQDAAPDDETLPGSHCVHVSEPTDEYLPEAQKSHIGDEEVENIPAKQSVQAVSLMPPYRPAEHASQEVCSASGIVPAVQNLHADAPVSSVY